MFILGIVPARAGSKGILHKNLFPLCGSPLIDYTVEAAKWSNLDDIVINTDDTEILSRFPMLSIRRPPELSQDDTPMLPVIQSVLRIMPLVDAVMLLQPTSPLRTANDINEALTAFKTSHSDSLYSGYYMGIKHKEQVYDKHKNKPHFQRNGGIFIAKTELIWQGKLWSDNVIEFEMPKSRSIDIDDMDDMRMAEALIKFRGIYE